MNERMPTVDLLVPTRARHDSIRASLPSWRAAADGAGIILCDQSPTPFTAPDMRVLHRPDLGGLPAARNVLLATSTAEVVVFLDDDCEVAPDFVHQVRRLAAREPTFMAWGPVVEQRSRWARRLHRLAQLGCFADPRRLVAGACDRPTWALFGCCFAVRRAVALAVGFDARRSGYALGEDLDFFRRLADRHPPHPARFVRALVAHHREDGANRADRAARGRAAPGARPGGSGLRARARTGQPGGGPHRAGGFPGHRPAQTGGP
jgi:GT2 family glycosyltransferase